MAQTAQALRPQLQHQETVKAEKASDQGKVLSLPVTRKEQETADEETAVLSLFLF